MANETRASWRSVARARDTFFPRSSYDPAQPTQKRTSTSGGLASANVRTGNGSSFVQAPRSAAARFHGFPCRSMPLKAVCASFGNSLRSRTRCRLRSVILSTYVIPTGQACSQYRQVVQAQIVSSETQPPIRGLALLQRRRSRPAAEARRGVEERRGVGIERMAEVHGESLRRQRLPRQVRRADLAAAPALGAGVDVELLLPGEVLDLPDAEDPRLGRLLDVDRGHLPRRVELREEEVRERREDVEVLREGEVVQEEEDREEMEPPGREIDGLEGTRRRTPRDSSKGRGSPVPIPTHSPLTRHPGPRPPSGRSPSGGRSAGESGRRRRTGRAAPSGRGAAGRGREGRRRASSRGRRPSRGGTPPRNLSGRTAAPPRDRAPRGRA